jgi:transcriptional regulator with XRE-family HTH domain
MKLEHRDKYTKLGLKISYYRKLSGLTQEQLAEKLDMNAAFIGHIEAPNIDKAISLDTLFDIAEVLQVSPDKFLKFDD